MTADELRYRGPVCRLAADWQLRDGSRTLSGRFRDDRVLCWHRSGLIVENSGRADQPVLLLAGLDTGSLTLEQESGERRRAIEIRQLSRKRLRPVLLRKRRTQPFCTEVKR
jgi:hypothetical protein